MLGSLHKSDNEFDDVKLNIKYEGQRGAKTRGDVCDIRRCNSVCNLKTRVHLKREPKPMLSGISAHVLHICPHVRQNLCRESQLCPPLSVNPWATAFARGLLCLEGRCDADAGADISHHARHSPAPCRSVANGSSSRQRLWGLWGEMIETRCLPLRVVSPKHIR